MSCWWIQIFGKSKYNSEEKYWYVTQLAVGKIVTNDIAVVKLDKKVAFTKSIYPICLPKYGESFVGREARVVGWGLVNGSESSGKSSLNELT